MNNDGIEVVRIWKRSGTGSNVMSLESAALNLKSNALPLEIRGWDVCKIADLLLTGRIVQTTHAVFCIASDGIKVDEPVLIGGKDARHGAFPDGETRQSP